VCRSRCSGCVPHDVFDGAIEKFPVAADDSIATLKKDHGTEALPGFVFGVRKELLAEAVQRDGREGEGIFSGLHGRCAMS
jgi:hypothetical protein